MSVAVRRGRAADAAPSPVAVGCGPGAAAGCRQAAGLAILLAPMTESDPSAADPAALAAQARQALAFFEAALADRGVLIHLDEDLRRRLLEAAGRVARPDPWQKREFLREARRQRKEQKRAEDERKLSSTGIRKLRREAVFLTPPALPAPVAATSPRGLRPSVAASLGSGPMIAARMRAQSSLVHAMGPGWSSDCASGWMPWLLTSP
jgi:hypothetical protein